jgi:putative transposase
VGLKILGYTLHMPSRLKRFQQTNDFHFLTFSCYRRLPLFGNAEARTLFLTELECARIQYKFGVLAYVVMPEHVHLLLAEPEELSLSVALQMLKQNVSRKARKSGLYLADHAFWETRYFDFNVWSRPKQTEKLRYIHRNPVVRGLVQKPEEWQWSSFRHYLLGERGLVEIASERL